MGRTKRAIIDPADVIYKEAIEAFTLKQANECFKGARYQRWWPDHQQTFYGHVKRVDKDLPDKNGEIERGFLFLIE